MIVSTQFRLKAINSWTSFIKSIWNYLTSRMLDYIWRRPFLIIIRLFWRVVDGHISFDFDVSTLWKRQNHNDSKSVQSSELRKRPNSAWLTFFQSSRRKSLHCRDIQHTTYLSRYWTCYLYLSIAGPSSFWHTSLGRHLQYSRDINSARHLVLRCPHVRTCSK